jgi:predicted small metal-binding protein
LARTAGYYTDIIATRRYPMALVVNCPCGQTIRAENEEELIEKVTEHGKQVHNQTATREQILAMAKTE